MNVTLRLIKGDRAETVASTLPLREGEDTYTTVLTDEGSRFQPGAMRRREVCRSRFPQRAWVRQANGGAAIEDIGAIIRSCPCFGNNNAIGAINVSRRNPGAVYAEKQVASAQDLRRSGRHRDRERAAVQGASGAQQRPCAGARAADRNQRDSQRHQPARRPTRNRCSRRS